MNKIRPTKIISAVASILFVAVLFVGMYVLFTSEKAETSFYENRNLAAMPVRNTESIMNGKYFSDIELFLKEHAPWRENVLTFMTNLDMNVLKRPVVNDVIIADDCLLEYNKYEQVNEQQIAERAEKISENLNSHASQVETYGGEFYYIAVPCQYVCLEDKYDWYLNSREEYTTASSTALFERLDKKNVKYIDMLKWYKEAGNPMSFTSAVDNHYGIEGGYAVYSELIRRINQDTDLNLDLLEDGEYTLKTLPNYYLGSRARKLFGMYPETEHLSVIQPNEQIPFTRYDWSGETPSAPTVYQMPATETEEVMYALYMGGDISKTIIDTNRKDLPSIFVYGDSFTNAVESVLWYNFDKMYSIDFRHQKDITVEQFIEQNKPDIVICIRDYQALLVDGENGQ